MRRLILLGMLTVMCSACSIPRWPVDGVMTSPYGLRLRGWSPDMHEGVLRIVSTDPAQREVLIPVHGTVDDPTEFAPLFGEAWEWVQYASPFHWVANPLDAEPADAPIHRRAPSDRSTRGSAARA